MTYNQDYEIEMESRFWIVHLIRCADLLFFQMNETQETHERTYRLRCGCHVRGFFSLRIRAKTS